MSFTYDSSSLSTELNRIRLEIGDTNEDDPLLNDAEITKIQAEYSNFYRRCSACCRLVSSKFARDVDYAAGIVSEKSSQLSKRYDDMAKRYAQLGAASYPWSTSVSEDDKDDIETDTSLVKPKFSKGMHDNT